MARDLDRLAPLAERMRPRSLDEFVGQEHILGPDTVLRRSLDAGHIPSMVLWGPPGTGKTTLAQIIANSANAHFERVSAVTSGVADLRRVVSDAADRLGMHGERTILFVDEIHRFNKAQQDVILPHVERGTVILIGATTENPSFEVISPLLSRARVYTLRQLTARADFGDTGLRHGRLPARTRQPETHAGRRRERGAHRAEQWRRPFRAEYARTGGERNSARRDRRHAGACPWRLSRTPYSDEPHFTTSPATSITIQSRRSSSR